MLSVFFGCFVLFVILVPQGRKSELFAAVLFVATLGFFRLMSFFESPR